MPDTPHVVEDLGHPTSPGLQPPRRPARELPGDGIIRHLVSANLEARFHNVLEAVPDAIVGCDAGRLVRLVNARAEALFGYGRAELLGRHVEVLFPGHRGFIVARNDEGGHRQPDRPSGVEVTALRSDGTAFPAEVTLTHVDTGSGPLAVVAVRDVTERRRAAAELERALERERKAGERLRELDGLKDEFLSTVSHELRTPLTSIAGFADLLLDERGPGDETLRRDLLGRVRNNANEMARMVERILDYSRMEAGRVDLRPEPVELLQAVARCVDGLADVLHEHHVHATLAPGTTVVVDRQAFDRILGNLLTNAAKYSPPASPISVVGAVSGSQAAVRVRDHGPGIPIEDQPHLFDRFFRGTALSTGRRGTGIGLSIVQRYVALSGGRVWFEGPDGGGSEFVFTLPLAARGA